MSNIFSDKEWAESWQEAIRSDNRFKQFALGAFSFVCRKRRRPHPFNRFIEYPGQEIAYDIDVIPEVKAAGNYFNELKDTCGWDIIDFRHMNSQSVFLTALENLSGDGIVKILRQDDKVWELDLSGSFQEYLNSLTLSLYRFPLRHQFP